MYPTSQGNRIFRGAVVKLLNFRENLDADSDKDLVSLNLQNSQEYDSISESKTNEEPLLEGLPVEEEEVAVADILNQSSSMIASADDDLPLGTEANTLSGLPSTAVLSSPGSQNVEEEHQYSSLSLPAKSSSSLTSLGQQASNTHPWLQALSGRQQSFGSDLSTGTTSSVNSIEILLQGREADPEEILMSLGFGSTEDDSTVTSRIPSRFLMLNSEARGVSVDDLFGQHSELQELISNWNCPKYTTGQLVNPIHVSKALQFLSANEVPSRYLQPTSGTMRTLIGIEGEGDNETKEDLPPSPSLLPQMPSHPQQPPPPPYHEATSSSSPKKDKALRTSKYSDLDNRISDEKLLKSAKSLSPYHSPVRNPILTDLTLNEEGFDDISWSSDSSVTLSSYINLRLAPNESLV